MSRSCFTIINQSMFFQGSAHAEVCSGCRRESLAVLPLDCQHSLCLICLEGLVTALQQEQTLRDELEICCPLCKFQTFLAVPLAYKLVRPLRDQTFHQQNSTLVCLDCLTFVSFQNLIENQHYSHRVESIQQTYPLFKQLALKASRELSKTFQVCQRETDKLVHCKEMLSDVFVNNSTKIRNVFEDVRAELARREKEILTEYEQITDKNCEIINQNIRELSRQMEEANSHEIWINEKIENSDPLHQIADSYQTVRYFIQNYHQIVRINEAPQTSVYQIPTYKEMISINRESVDFAPIKRLIMDIRTMGLLKGEDDDLSTSQSLSRQYFEGKRRQLRRTGIKDPLQSYQRAWKGINNKQTIEHRSYNTIFRDDPKPIASRSVISLRKGAF